MNNYTKLAFHLVDASNLSMTKSAISGGAMEAVAKSLFRAAKAPAIQVAGKMMQTPGSGLRSIAEATAKKHVPLPRLSELRKAPATEAAESISAPVNNVINNLFNRDTATAAAGGAGLGGLLEHLRANANED